MPHYISLVKWTDQGVKTVKDSPKRSDMVTNMAEKMGAKMQVFYTMGDYDLVALTEAPNDETAMRLLLQIGTIGTVRTTTMKAWTPSEATKIIAKLE